MKYNCPNCQQEVNLPDNSEGKRFRCPKCKKIFVAEVPIVGVSLDEAPSPVQEGPIAETSEQTSKELEVGSLPTNRLRTTASTPTADTTLARLEDVVKEAGMVFSKPDDSVLQVIFDLGDGRSDFVLFRISENLMADGSHLVFFVSSPCSVELDDEKLTELPVALYAVLMKMNTSMVFGSFCIAGHLAIRATTILETLRPGDCREICEEIVRRRDEFDEFSKALSQ